MAPDTLDVEVADLLQQPEVLRCAAADVERGDQLALSSPDDGEVAGEVTAARLSGDRSTVALVVENRVHFVPADHDVVVIRMRTGKAL